MTADKNCEELRPCPFCGLKPKIIDTNQTLFHDPQYDGGDYRCCGDYFQVKYGDWQNAYCWKELDKLRAERDKFRSALHSISLGLFSTRNAKEIAEEVLQGAGEGE